MSVVTYSTPARESYAPCDWHEYEEWADLFDAPPDAADRLWWTAECARGERPELSCLTAYEWSLIERSYAVGRELALDRGESIYEADLTGEEARTAALEFFVSQHAEGGAL